MIPPPLLFVFVFRAFFLVCVCSQKQNNKQTHKTKQNKTFKIIGQTFGNGDHSRIDYFVKCTTQTFLIRNQFHRI